MKFLHALIALAYTAFFLSLSSDPFTDAPNHLARAAVMKSLWFDPHSPFQGIFSAHSAFLPYLLPDLGLVLFGHFWITLTMLALVAAIWFYATQLLETPWAISAAVLCSWYLATNYLFILGFFSFQWGVAASFLALGALHRWRRNHSPAWYALYATACLLTYGSHLAAFAILAAIVTTTSLLRRNLRELIPLAILLAYHILFVAHPEAYTGTQSHNTVADKFGHFLEALFVRQNYVIDRTILLLFLAILLIRRWTHLRKHWELTVTCALSAAIYFALPIGLSGIYYVDERALPYFYIPLLILSLSLLEPNKLLLPACAVLAIANLASLAHFLPRQNREVAQYRQALNTIPEHQTVLPIYTLSRDGNTYPLRHAASFYVADRHGYIPYLFSQINGGGPSGYFQDHSPIYRPPQDWYMTATSPDWTKIAQTYDYVVITKPWNPAKIDRTNLDKYYENAAASIFKIKPHAEP